MGANKTVMEKTQLLAQLPFVKAIRSGFMRTLPVLLVGAFAKVLHDLPINGYQSFLQTFLDGAAEKILRFAADATLGMISVFAVVFIAYSYATDRFGRRRMTVGSVLVSLSAFLILTGMLLPSGDFAALGLNGIFFALFSACAAVPLLGLWEQLFSKKRVRRRIGVELELERSLTIFLPVLLVTVIFAIFAVVVTRLSGDESVYAAVCRYVRYIFEMDVHSFGAGISQVLAAGALGFLGFDILSYLPETIPAAVVFVGGTGSVLCLVLAVLLFSRNRSTKTVGAVSAFPAVLGCGAPMLLGMPVIFDPIFLLPSLIVPAIAYTLVYFAQKLSLVGAVTPGVASNYPALWSGWSVFGGFGGLLLALVILAVGTAVFVPFVRLSDHQRNESYKRGYEVLVEYFRSLIGKTETVKLTELDNKYGEVARSLSEDLRTALSEHQISLRYQPQYDYNGKCVGVESLMRWKHPIYGMIFPPLVVTLATESDMLEALEEYIVTLALENRSAVYEKFGKGIQLSVNVTGTSIARKKFMDFLKEYDRKHGLRGKNILFEISEEATMNFNLDVKGSFAEMRNMGVRFAIDDFSMTPVSVSYLKENLFDVVKLDSSIVRDIDSNPRSKEIAANVISMAGAAQTSVMAQYVENAAQREVLHQMGCDVYQGYLYSPAVDLDKRN